MFILLFFFYNFTYAGNKFSVGMNYGGERISYNFLQNGIYNDGDYHPLNTKIEVEGFYKTDLFGLGIGFSQFEDQYQLAFNSYKLSPAPPQFNSNNIAFALKAYVNFKERPNAFFFSIVNDFVYSTSATKIIYYTSGKDTEILKLEKTTFNRWVLELGIGYKLRIVEKIYIKALPYFSCNVLSKPILFQLPEFYKLGISVGVFRVF